MTLFFPAAKYVLIPRGLFEQRAGALLKIISEEGIDKMSDEMDCEAPGRKQCEMRRVDSFIVHRCLLHSHSSGSIGGRSLIN